MGTGEKLLSDVNGAGGDSGGPLFDLEGRLIGINSYAMRHRMWHVSIDRFKEHWERLREGERWGGLKPGLSFNLGDLPRPSTGPPERAQELLAERTKPVAPSIVRIFDGEVLVCLGTVVERKGFILTKASALPTETVCELPGGGRKAAVTVATDPDLALALMKVDAGDLSPIDWPKEKTLPLGRWLVGVSAEGEPVAVGIVGTPSFELPLHVTRLSSWFDLDWGEPSRIQLVQSYTKAQKAGLRPGQTILSVNEQPAPALEAFHQLISQAPARGTVALELRDQNGQELTASVAPAPRGGMRLKRGADGKMEVVQPANRSEPVLPPGRQTGLVAVIQHDTALGPELNGGPLLGTDGAVAGINIGAPGGPASFAVPAGVAREFVEANLPAE